LSSQVESQMARLNPGYGSELHLLRMLGRHRNFFDRQLLLSTGAEGIEWLDFPAGDMQLDKAGKALWDSEWHHLEFLPRGDPARVAWQQTWPIHRPGHRWDAVGRLLYEASWEWLLIEAKANVEELSSDCAAQDPESLKLIRRTMDETKIALGVPSACDWLLGYYQYCNRLAALHVMNNNGTSARMAYIYFIGDVKGIGRLCPASQAEWDGALAVQDKHVGLPREHGLVQRVHKLFLNCSAK
jgi:hypothetical protein